MAQVSRLIRRLKKKEALYRAASKKIAARRQRSRKTASPQELHMLACNGMYYLGYADGLRMTIETLEMGNWR